METSRLKPRQRADAKDSVVPGSTANLPLVMNVEEDFDLLRSFINESNECLTHIEREALVLERNPANVDTLNSIFRAFHTFKGSSGFLNLLPIQRLAHEMESVLDLAREQRLAITSEVINLILRGADALKQFITEMELQLNGVKPVAPYILPMKELFARIQTLIESSKKEAQR